MPNFRVDDKLMSFRYCVSHPKIKPIAIFFVSSRLSPAVLKALMKLSTGKLAGRFACGVP